MTAAIQLWPEGGGLRVLGKLRIPALKMVEGFKLSNFALGLGVGVRIWHDLFMGVDLLLRADPAPGNTGRFDSAASGEYQVYVRPLSSEGERVTVTAHGGRWPAWSRDGRTLFFRRGREVRAVAATVTGDGVRFGEERAVLEWDVARSFEVGPDGTFYGTEPVPGAAVQTSLELQTGWFAEVERLAGPARR
jgi:hypothetical protein